MCIETGIKAGRRWNTALRSDGRSDFWFWHWWSLFLVPVAVGMGCVGSGSWIRSSRISLRGGLYVGVSEVRQMHRWNLPCRPVSLQSKKLIATFVIVLQFGLQKCAQIRNTFCFCFLDILHTSENVLVGLFVFSLLGTELLFDPEILPLCLLHLREGRIVCQSTLLKLLARSLRESVIVRKESANPYLIFLHHRQ